MSVPPNKSPIATRPGPNSRNSEIANPVRRSFTANPFAKPSIAAAPSETPPRRSSMGRETVVTFRDSEDKENGKDSGNWKQIRVRSPAAKNFMSPTISAASKINASPRKKILAERNEPVRTSSPSVSDFKAKRVTFAPSPTEVEEVGPMMTTPVAAAVGSETPRPDFGVEEMVPLGCPEPVCENASDMVNLDPSFKISPPPAVSERVIAPLDADPSAPPYDPKTNFLSPRPQFLHYRPNPRVQYYLSNDGEGKRLEESFISESLSDAEGTEETLSDYSTKEVEDVTSPAQVVKEEEEAVMEEEEEEVPVSEPIPFTSPSIESMSKEEVVEVEESSEPRFSWISKCIALVMILAVALFAVSSVEVNVEDWFASSVSFISNIRGAKNVGTLQYYNLTLMEDARVNECSVFDQCKEMGEFDGFGIAMGSVVEVEASEEKVLQDIGAADYEEPIDQEAGLAEIGEAEYAEPIAQEAEVPEIDYLEEDQPGIGVNTEEHVEQGYEQVENTGALEGELRPPAIGAAENPVDLHADPEGPECKEMVESTNMEEVVSHYEDGGVLESVRTIIEKDIVVDNSNSEPESIASNKEEIVSSEVLNLTAEGGDSMVSMVSVLGIAFLVLTLVGFSAITYMKKRENSPSNPGNYAVKPLVTKKLAASPTVPISTEHTYCPSEMSSFQTSSAYNSKGLKASDEVESQEKRIRKNNRRDSVASIDSSMGSPSYGSFTTYERIPIKKGYGEEKIVTPVRRSSRIIRKQVTSP